MKDNDKKMLFGIGIVFLFLATVSFTYAYFTATIVNKDVKDQVVETGTLSLRYVDGAEIVMQNIKPGDTITKTVYVANTGTLDVIYNLVWQELTNEITNDEMVIEGTCTRINSTTEAEDGTCEAITNAIVSSRIIKGKISIEPNIIHKYDLTITFKETNDSQNYNQGKKFNGVLGVEETKITQFEKDSWETIVTNVKNNNISNYNLGDTKMIDLGIYGIQTVRIANTSTPEECSTEGFSQTACGFVLEFNNILSTRSINVTNTNKDGWPASVMHTYLNTDLYNAFPADLKSSVIDTIVVSGHGASDSDNFVSTDKLYLLSPKEIYSNWSNTNDSAKDLTRQLDYYNSINVSTGRRSGAVKKFGTAASKWWLRTAGSTSPTFFLYVYIDGDWGSDFANKTYGVSPVFRIG